MRNTSARVLLGAGAFSVTLAALVAGVATPALLKAPLVNSVTTQASGPATKLDAATGAQVAGTFRQVATKGTHTVGGKAAGDSDVAVYDSYSASSFAPAGGGPVAELTKILYTQAFDRSTGVGRPSVAGDTLGTTAHAFKLPFDVQKTTYQLWDSSAEKAFPLRYTRETTVGGLDVYAFTQDATATDLGELPVLKAVPGALVGEPQTPSIPAHEWYENLGKVVYVEPVTGSIVGGKSNPHLWAQTADGRKVDVLKAQGVGLVPASQSEVVADAKDNAKKAGLLHTAPWVLGVLGLVLLVAGFVMLRRRPVAAHTIDLDERTTALPVPRAEDPVRVTERR
ncbi:MAG: hypothetical protein JWN17_214 [Frankiales bacterium]|nr:hypothetical protein [Frankiales bacterium]